jgi:hypothetical protein
MASFCLGCGTALWECGFCPHCGEPTGLCGFGRTVLFEGERVVLVRLPHPRDYCLRAETGTGRLRILTTDGPVDTGLCAVHEQALASVTAAGGIQVWRIPPARPRLAGPRQALAAAWHRAFGGAAGRPVAAGQHA